MSCIVCHRQSPGRMIKKTRNPIMCICNDSHSPKALCLDFSRKFQGTPSVLQVRSLASRAQIFWAHLWDNGGACVHVEYRSWTDMQVQLLRSEVFQATAFALHISKNPAQVCACFERKSIIRVRACSFACIVPASLPACVRQPARQLVCVFR